MRVKFCNSVWVRLDFWSRDDLPEFGNSLTSRIGTRSAILSPKRRSGRPGFARPGTCKTHFQMNEFRFRHLNDRRGLELLQHLGRFAQLEPRPSGPRRADNSGVFKGSGLSYIHYELVGPMLELPWDVEVNALSANIRVTRFSIVHDCGQVHKPRWQSNRRQRGANYQPYSSGRGQVQSRDDYEPRLGDLPDPHVPRDPRDRN